ncbi:AAA family ATPase [Pseudomonas moraviensis]|uniref:Recombinational DNA repair ATPase RecF n=1 Tax=Pseudomonas moraviensis TaxID=321662 RepID=A0A7Z0AWY1_9PSED|nr:AAA family ATPase [Pseudomonas moraviensis]NYH11915.1 recombinational DNA repair ATPase RecF [Pseudomonas moraviensis]
MSSALHDYQQFLAWLHVPERGSTEDTRRFANLVEQNFDIVAANSRALSRRSVVLATKARESLLQTDFNPPAVAGAVTVGQWAWRALDRLTVGPFRGFRVAETFTFPQRITMFYGPNGSGKTSLCEALELALLGGVDEASAKRIPPQRYFANLHENRYEAPVLAARGAEGQVSTVQADSEAYRFCFVEKNRIDNFSRIAAKSAGEKKDLIAALFGMQQFHDFVTNFNESMDQQLDLVAIKQQELETQRSALQRDHATINGELQAVQAIAHEEAAYAGAHATGLSYQQLLELIGSDAAPGRLHYLNAQLDGPTPGVYGVSNNALAMAYQAADREQEQLEDVDKRLTAKVGETSFQNLYNAVLGLQALSPDNCPACGTPINGDNHVVRDPYMQARNGLAQLQELASLQAEKNTVRSEWEGASRGLEGLLTAFGQRVSAHPDHVDDRLRYLASPGADHSTAWWKRSFVKQGDTPSMAQRIVDLAAECERIDAQTLQALADRSALAHERSRLVQAAQAVAGFQTRRAEVARLVGIARQTIANFDQANAALIDAVQQEAVQLALGRRIKAAYDEFLRLLRQFRSELPGALIAGLNNVALEIYNEFNRRDHDGDKLAALYLPTNEDERIGLAFRAAPEARVDALHVLSEGHVRCLGVAILLAKALHIQAPTIIFDDAINAIDTEHREGIREAIFQSNRFAATQIIVTCHSSEFIKDLQNHVERGQWTAYYFMPHIGDHRPRVRGNENTFNYLQQARAALDIGDWRNALGASRQALEMLTDKIWKWLGKNDLGVITLPLAGRGAEPNLRNLCEALKKRLDDARTFVHQDKPGVVQGLGDVIGVPVQSNVWTYLNKGIHEEADRDDYDPNLVLTIVETLERMNQLRLGSMPVAIAGAAQAAVVQAVADAANPR